MNITAPRTPAMAAISTGDRAMALDIRKSATHLTDAERDRFLEALIRLRYRPANIPTIQASVYDQYVALHQAVMVVTFAGQADTINMGHWNIGFLAWHREYLRRFELTLQSEMPGVTVPYWDWADHEAARSRLFADSFLGRLPSVQGPQPITRGVFSFDGPTPRPPWWPAGAAGWRIPPVLQEPGIVDVPPGSPNAQQLSATLQRAGDPTESWPPTVAYLAQLVRLRDVNPPDHDLWFFWRELEQGAATHNTGHRFIGGHMSGALSPNDPIFWLHHANVDRLWEEWQRRRGGARGAGYPPLSSTSPFDGDPAPLGHKVDDAMWPWVGNAAGYGSAVDPQLRRVLIDYSTEPARRVRDVLDPADLGSFGGYLYE